MVLISSYTSNFSTWITEQLTRRWVGQVSFELRFCRCFPLINLLVLGGFYSSSRVHRKWQSVLSAGPVSLDHSALSYQPTKPIDLHSWWNGTKLWRFLATRGWQCNFPLLPPPRIGRAGCFPRFRHWIWLQPLDPIDPCTRGSREQHCQDVLLWSSAWRLAVAMIPPISSKIINFERHLPIFL